MKSEYVDGVWIKEFGAAITVCDKDGKIVEMNDRSVATFAKYGGKDLVGSDLFSCHSEKSRGIIEAMMHHQDRINCYTIEKNGIKKMVYQAPWYKDGQFLGLVELSLPLPCGELPHYLRQA